jgi:NAD(P)-dependent dehydrogenase (short-subunit alcohol dehydrogenase family)
LADGANAAIFGRRKANIESAAADLSKETGSKCIGISGDVRKLETLQEAVKQTLKEFGRIDFVIAGAAGNFLAPLDGRSVGGSCGGGQKTSVAASFAERVPPGRPLRQRLSHRPRD